MRLAIWAACLIFIGGCASTSSVMVNHERSTTSTIAIMPLEGQYGAQTSDLIAEQLAASGIPTIERAQIDVILRENGYRGNANFDQSSIAEYGRLLGVKKIFTGTVTTDRGPLSSFPHANITLKLIDVATGKVTWIGRYGNSYWTSAVTTQGDLQRGARDIVSEFVKVHGTKFD